MSERPTVRIGVLVVPPTGCQLLDLACVDVFAIASHSYLKALGDYVPAPLADIAPNVEIKYISTVKSGSLMPLTADMKIEITHAITDPEAAPGALDIVVVPGPDPHGARSDEVKTWLRTQGTTEGVYILSVCTGIFIVGEAGLLKGRKACGPRDFQEAIKRKFEGVKRVGSEYRWVNDGNLWSSGKFPRARALL